MTNKHRGPQFCFIVNSVNVFSLRTSVLLKLHAEQVVLENNPAISLTFTANGEPVPNIAWTEVFANGSDSSALFIDEHFILPNKRTNDGTYRSKASSGIGNDVNHTVNVVVDCEYV